MPYYGKQRHKVSTGQKTEHTFSNLVTKLPQLAAYERGVLAGVLNGSAFCRSRTVLIKVEEEGHFPDEREFSGRKGGKEGARQKKPWTSRFLRSQLRLGVEEP